MHSATTHQYEGMKAITVTQPDGFSKTIYISDDAMVIAKSEHNGFINELWFLYPNRPIIQLEENSSTR